MHLLVYLINFLCWQPVVEREQLKAPCGPGFVSVYIEVYEDRHHPYEVTSKGFYCVPTKDTVCRSIWAVPCIPEPKGGSR